MNHPRRNTSRKPTLHAAHPVLGAFCAWGLTLMVAGCAPVLGRGRGAPPPARRFPEVVAPAPAPAVAEPVRAVRRPPARAVLRSGQGARRRGAAEPPLARGARWG